MTTAEIIKAIEKHNNVTKAARELGVSSSFIYKILKANGLKVSKSMEVVEHD